MGNESSFGRSSKTLYRMAVPDVFQKGVKVVSDFKRNIDVYDDNINMSEISSISRGLLLNELKIITQIEEKKAIVAGALNQILSGNKAKDIYINISGR